MPKAKNDKQKRWKPLLFPVHKHYWKTAYKRLLPKLSRLRKEWGNEIEEMIASVYGHKCPYCDNTLKVTNISVDHKIPVYLDGKTEIYNAEVVCKRCNTRKGPMSKPEYMRFLVFLEELKENSVKYILRKLAQSDRYFSKKKE